MRICFIVLLKMEVSGLPSIFEIGGYKVFFWSNEHNEPIHVHVAKGKATANATKIWLTSNGGAIVAKNSSRIPKKELRLLLDVITAQYFFIIREWKNHFQTDIIDFFC